MPRAATRALSASFAAQAHDPSYRGISGYLSALVEADRGCLDEARGHTRRAGWRMRRIGRRRESAIIASRGACSATSSSSRANHERGRAAAFGRLPDRLLRSGQPARRCRTMTWPDADRGAHRRRRPRRGGACASRSTTRHRAPAGGSHAIAVARVRGLVAAARGDTGRRPGGARAGRRRRRPTPEDVPVRARAGAARPRNGAAQARQRRAARETLEQALAAFERARRRAVGSASARRAATGERAAAAGATSSRRPSGAWPRSPHRDTATRRSLPGWSSRSGRSRRTSPASTASSACDPAPSSAARLDATRDRAVQCVGVSQMCRATRAT